MAEMQEQPLQQLFATAQRLFQQAKAGASADACAANEAVDLLNRCTDAVNRLALFSSNEERDDLATPDLKYLSIPFLHAELRASGATVDMRMRLAALNEAMEMYMRYLHRLKQYGLLDEQGSAIFDRLEAGEKSDPTTLRTSKIAMFKRQKEAKAKLEAISRARLQSHRDAALDSDDENAGSAVDEESERDAWFLQLDLYAMKALSQLSTLQQERDMLQHMAAMPEADRCAAAASNAPPPELMRQLLSAGSTLEAQRAAGLQSARADIRQNLLRPSHNLPTRSLAQQAEIEIARAKEAEQKQEAAQRQRAAVDENSEADDDEAVRRQRAMDDWKDTHPAGYGNSKLRPTA